MKPFKMGHFLMAAAMLVGAGVAGAADTNKLTGPETDAAIANKVRHEIVMYPRYSIWDEISFSVTNGTVHLDGAVTQPFKKDDIARIAQRVAGVTQVQDDIHVLPISSNDDRLRMQVARAIYGDPTMIRYANQPFKPIHILVENGHVTLAGVVDTQFDKQIAGMRASGVGMSFGKVINNLQVANPPKS